MGRRLRVLRVEPSLIIECLNGLPNTFVSLPAKPLGLPEDVQVVDVWYEGWTRSLNVTLEHPSFEVVPDGQIIPIIEDMYARRAVFTKRRVNETHLNCDATAIDPATDPESWRKRPSLL